MENGVIESAKHRVKYWWVSLLVGVLALAVGIMSTASSVVTVSILTIFFIASFLVSGIFEIIFAVSNREHLSQWGWTLASGIISFIFACILLAMPIGSMVIFIYYISFYILLQALMGLWATFAIKKYEPSNWWLFLILAILGVIFGIFLIVNPLFAASFITIVFAASLICYGLFRIFYAFRLKKLKDSFD